MTQDFEGEMFDIPSDDENDNNDSEGTHKHESNGIKSAQYLIWDMRLTYLRFYLCTIIMYTLYHHNCVLHA